MVIGSAVEANNFNDSWIAPKVACQCFICTSKPGLKIVVQERHRTQNNTICLTCLVLVTQKLGLVVRGCKSPISKKGLNLNLPHLSERLNKIMKKNRFRGLPSPTHFTDYNGFGMNKYKRESTYVPVCTYLVSWTIYLIILRLICLKMTDGHSKLLLSQFVTSLSQ